jgi:hypothetical protein
VQIAVLAVLTAPNPLDCGIWGALQAKGNALAHPKKSPLSQLATMGCQS